MFSVTCFFATRFSITLPGFLRNNKNHGRKRSSGGFAEENKPFNAVQQIGHVDDSIAVIIAASPSLAKLSSEPVLGCLQLGGIF
jgi:hypothetical protein